MKIYDYQISRIRHIFIVLIILLISVATNTDSLMGDEGFIVCYVDRFPYHYIKEGKIEGFVGKASDYAFKKSGFPFRWQETPAIRMMVMLKESQEKVAMAGWFKNSEREKIGKFSIPVYQDKPSTIIIKRDNEQLKKIKSFNSLLSDKKLTLLIKEGYSYGKDFDGMIKKYNTNTLKVTVDMVKMVQMINAGRGDYMFSTQEEVEYLIKSAGVDRNQIEVKTFSDAPKGEYRYIFFSKRVSDEEIRTINRYIKEYNDKK